MNSVIKYIKQIVVVCLLVYSGLPINTMQFLRGAKKEVTQKQFATVEERRANFKKLNEDLQQSVQERYKGKNAEYTAVTTRLGYLIQNISSGFSTLSKEELDTLVSKDTNIGRYFRQALLDTVDGVYFTDFSQFFQSQGRSYYIMYKEGEGCMLFDRYFNDAVVNIAAVQLVETQKEKISKEMIKVLTDDLERFLGNISASLTTSITCFKNHLKKFESNTTVLTRLLFGSIAGYVFAESIYNTTLDAYNKMTRTEKIKNKLKFWGKNGRPAKVPKDYIYAAMAVLSKNYSQETWDNYITENLTPFMTALLKKNIGITKANSVVHEISSKAKDPSFLRKHWGKILGGLTVAGFGTILYYNWENISKTWGENKWEAITNALKLPFQKSSYAAGLESGKYYLGQLQSGVTSTVQKAWSNVRQYVPNRPAFLGGKPSVTATPEVQQPEQFNQFQNSFE